MRRLIGRAVIPAVLLATFIGACSQEKTQPAPPRSAEQQRTVDSTIGASALPGARGVRGALKASDTAKARQAQLDSLSKEP
ncbi:MAG: hypothetical protein IT357_13395 [Gemmatimonadaceae bacterium]|nr:hypothetical protein [Gemmatimonadaceae bacterium]